MKKGHHFSCLDHLLCFTSICFPAAASGTARVTLCGLSRAGCVGEELEMRSPGGPVRLRGVIKCLGFTEEFCFIPEPPKASQDGVLWEARNSI